jgi:CBS domain containing-hemolysin-like protein
MIVLAVLFLVLLVLTAVLEGMETGIYSLERVRLEVSAEKGDRPAARLLRLIGNPTRTLCALLLATCAAEYALTAVADRMVEHVTPGQGVLARKVIDTLILGPILFVLGNLVPKNVFLQAPSGLMVAFQPLLSGVRLLFLPLAVPLVKLASRATPGPGEDAPESAFDRGGIRYLLTAEDEASKLTEAQRSVAGKVLLLRNTRVQDRMIPLSRTSSVPAGATAEEILAEGARSGHSRLPVLDAGKTRFLGYVNVIDAATAPKPFDLGSRLHELPSLPVDLPVTTALYRLQRAGRPIAAVTSPDGRSVLGIVAVSDIVSALFRV